MVAATDEYYAIRIERRNPRAGMDDHQGHDIFITESNKLGHITKAKRFASIEAAEEYLREHPVPKGYQHHIQLCITENRDHEDTEQSRITAQLMEIPYPYRRTAYNWMRGKDVEGLLRGESDEVYERHHNFLLDYDIDISHPSPVVLISARKKVSRKVHHDDLPDNAPRQFFASPSQRPSARPDKKTQD
jgi:hypothetical protein